MSRNFNDEFALMWWSWPPSSVVEASDIIQPEIKSLENKYSSYNDDDLIFAEELKKAWLTEKDFNNYRDYFHTEMTKFEPQTTNKIDPLEQEKNQKKEQKRQEREKEWEEANMLNKPLIWTSNNLKDVWDAMKIKWKLQHVENKWWFTLDNLKSSVTNSLVDLWNSLRFIANLPWDLIEWAWEVWSLVAHLPSTIEWWYNLAKSWVAYTGLIDDTEKTKAIREQISNSVKENFWTPEKFLETITQNPIDALTTVYSWLALWKWALKWTSKVADKVWFTNTAEKLANTANTLNKTQEAVIAPVKLTADLVKNTTWKVASWVWDAASAALWMTTWKWKDTIKSAFKYWWDIDYQKALKWELTQEDILNKAKKAFETIKEQRNELYWADYEKLKANKNLLDISDIKWSLEKQLDDMKVKIVPDDEWWYKLDFSKSTITQENAQKQVKEMVYDIATWDNTTPEMLDILKQRIQDRWLGWEWTSKSDNLSTFLSNAVKDKIVAEVPEYAEMTRKYEAVTNELREIDKVLSLWNNKNKMTAMTRLNQTLKNNTAFRKEMLEKLEDLAWVNLKAAIAWSNLSEWTPSWLMSLIWTWWIWYWLASWLSLWTVAWLPTMSPKLIWTTAKILWTSTNVIKKAWKTAREMIDWFWEAMDGIKSNNVSRFTSSTWNSKKSTKNITSNTNTTSIANDTIKNLRTEFETSAQANNIDLTWIKLWKDEGWNLLNIVSGVNSSIPKNLWKQTSSMKVKYNFKYDSLSKITKKIDSGDLQWTYVWWYDKNKKMPTLKIKVWKTIKSYHIPFHIKKKLFK